MNGDTNSLLPIDRFIHTLDIVFREGNHLVYSWHRLYSQEIDAKWVSMLPVHPELAERLEAFISRFGRMQDTIADKLLPRWLQALAESTGSQIETLNRAERLGVLDSVEDWLEARKLRNRLVHEYMLNEQTFADDLVTAKDFSLMLLDTYRRVRQFALTRMGLDEVMMPRDIIPPILPGGAV